MPISITLIGGPTALIEIDGFRLLTGAVERRVGGKSAWGVPKRARPRAIALGLAR